MKSLLDTYAQLMANCIDATVRTQTFKRGDTSSGRNLSSDGLINWLRNHNASRMPTAHPQAKCIEDHNVRWITPIVADRNDIDHFKDLPHFTRTGASALNGNLLEHSI